MKKYEELANILKLGQFLDDHTVVYRTVYDLLDRIGKGTISKNEQLKEELFTVSSALIHKGSTLCDFRKTKETLVADGIEEDRIPQIMTGASLCYLADKATETATAERKDNSQMQLRCLDSFLDKSAMKYLGIAT